MKKLFETFSKRSYVYAITLIILLMTVTIISCNKTEEQVTPTPSTQNSSTEEFKGFSLKTTTPLTSNDALITALKQTQDIVNFNPTLGTLDWNTANLATYEGTDVRAILVPVSKNRTLIAYTEKDNQAFKVMILEITTDLKTVNKDQDFDKFSGNINLLLTSGAKLQESNFKEGSLVSIKGMDASTLRTNENWHCFGNCLRNAWGNLPWWIRTACTASFRSCAFTLNPYACAVIAGCLGGYAAGCLWVCR